MAIVKKTNPKGVDKKIDRMQDVLFTNLSALGWTDYEVYPRAYKNYKESNRIPEIYIGEGDYNEVLFDDTKNVTSFFLVDDTTDISERKLTTNVSIIFQANLKSLFPTILHRPDEEMHVNIFESVKENNIGFELNKISTGVRNVYSDLEINGNLLEAAKLCDMSFYHIVKLDFSLGYEINCK